MKEHSELALPGKKGSCFVLNETTGPINSTKIKFLKGYWNYGWSIEVNEKYQPSHLEYIPQVWGGGGAKSDTIFQERLQKHLKANIDTGKYQRILAFNEPDKKDQSNMTVERSLQLWPYLEQMNVPLCSPSCANPLGCNTDDGSCQSVNGRWMKDFMLGVETNGYRCDYIGVHWYGGPGFHGFQKRMQEIYTTYGCRPLILTEFAIADWQAMNKTIHDNKFSRQQVLAFMKEALPWLERTPWVAGYAWFCFDAGCPQGTCSALFNSNGQPTALGRYYASVTTENPSGNQKETFQ